MFDEKTFILTLLSRPEDAKTFSRSFDPDWLNDARLVPLFIAIKDFLKKHEVSPSITALDKYLQDSEPEAYSLRHKAVLDDLKALDQPDFPLMVYTSRQAKAISICRSFNRLVPSANEMIAASDGDSLLKEVQKWLHGFHGLDEDLTLNFKDATSYLLEQYGINRNLEPIPTGVLPLDQWSGGGLWPKNLGIVVAPTGHGKSVVLMNTAANIARWQHKKVWFLTNELDMEEQTQRFLSFIQQHPVSEIQSNPLCAFKDLDKLWSTEGLDKRLIVTSVNREISTDDIEAELIKLIHLQGYVPDVLVLDFMERMRPSTSGFTKNETWNWIGAIAADLVRLARKYKIVVWTAAQTNRAGVTAEQLDMSMTQGSIKHLQEAACVVGMVQKSGDPDADPLIDPERVMRFFSLKQRHSKNATHQIEMLVDLNNMTITDDVYERKVESVGSPDLEEDESKPLKRWSKKDKPGYDKGKRAKI